MPGGAQGASMTTTGAQLALQQQAALLANQGDVAQPGSAAPAVANTVEGGADVQTGLIPGTGPGQSGGVGGTQAQGAAGQSGSNNTIFGNTGVGGQTFGGGAIVGVASKSKDLTIRIYNKKKTYDEWIFIYSPMLDRQNVLLRGPFNGMTFTGVAVGNPAGQMNQGQGSPQGGAPGVQLPPNQPPTQIQPQ